MLDQIDKPRTGGRAWCVYCRKAAEPGGEHALDGHYTEDVVFPILGGEFLFIDFVAIFPTLQIQASATRNGEARIGLYLCTPRLNEQDDDTINVSLGIGHCDENAPTVYEAEACLTVADAAELYARLRRHQYTPMDCRPRDAHAYRGTTRTCSIEIEPVGLSSMRISWIKGANWQDPDPDCRWETSDWGADRLQATFNSSDLDRLLSELGRLVEITREPVLATA